MIRPSLLLPACVLSALFSFSSRLPAQTAPVGYQYTPLYQPCRAIDTRITGGPIAGGTFQSFDPAGGACRASEDGPFPQNVPIAWAMNVTVVPHGPLGYLSVWPKGEPQPIVSTLNSIDGRVKANAAIVNGGEGGQVSVYVTNETDLILDITGYFTPTDVGGVQEVYTPAAPYRLVDTRNSMPLIQNQTSSFGFPAGPGMPYTQTGPYASPSLNVTLVPQANHPVGYLTTWMSNDETDVPIVSTLNSPTGAVVANATIASDIYGGNINAYASDNTDLVIDVTGTFTNLQNTYQNNYDQGLSFYPVSPCRVIDTREGVGLFQGFLQVPFVASPCKLPATAKAYVINATVVPSPILNYLTLWPDNGPSQPIVSTLNASDGSITSNMAIVGTNNGSINTYATNPTQLVIDVTGYFAPLQDTSGLKVVFMGDDDVYNAISAVQDQHPNWINAGGPAGETTDKMVARFQHDVLDKKPDVVVIDAGQYDMAQPGYDLEQYGGCGGSNDQMCNNIWKMFDMAYQAGVKVLIHPFLTCNYNCQAMAGANSGMLQIDMGEYNRLMVIGEGQGDPPHPVVDFTDLIGGVIAIIDGVNSTADPALAHAMARRTRAAR